MGHVEKGFLEPYRRKVPRNAWLLHCNQLWSAERQSEKIGLINYFRQNVCRMFLHQGSVLDEVQFKKIWCGTHTTFSYLTL